MNGGKRIWSFNEFYIAEIWTWENYGGKQVWLFMGVRYNEILLYIHNIQDTISHI